MKVALIIVLVLSIPAWLILLYDYVYMVIDHLSHYHIGQWKTMEQWQRCVERVCRKWAIKTPVLQMRDDYRYLLLDRINGSYGKAMVQSWQKAGCILGSFAVNTTDHREFIEEIKKQLLLANGMWIKEPDKVDYAILAYALLSCEEDPWSIKPAMDSMIECILKNKCEDGMISYSAGSCAKRRYVDTLGFVCPFLSLYGKRFNSKEMTDLAVYQLMKYQDGLTEGLPVHCYTVSDNLPVGILGWGRGAGWYALGLVDTLPNIDDQSQSELVKKYLQNLADVCLKYIHEDGGFNILLQDSGTRYDSSATAMLGYMLACCGKIFKDIRYTSAAEKCLLRLMQVTKMSGVIDECQGDTKDIGVFSMQYTAMPFVQGMALRLCAELSR